MANPTIDFDPGVGDSWDSPKTTPTGAGRGKQGISEALSLNNAPPIPKPALPTGPKPEPAPVAAPAAAAPAKLAEPSFDTMSDDELYRLSAIAKGSDDREIVARGLTAADLIEQRTNKQLGLLQDKKTLEEKTRKAEIDKDFAEKQRVLTEKQQKILDSEHGYFSPSKETAKDIASIFSIMTFATMGAGTVGKYHGMNALASLTGAMKGYKEGRDDLYKKEMDSYNKSLAEFGKHQEALLKQVELSQKLLSTDKDAAMSAAQAAIAMDTGGMAALKLRQGDYKGTMTILRHRLDAIDKAKSDADKLKEKKREAEKREDFAERRINITLDRQDTKGELVTGPDGKMYRVVGNKLEEIEGAVPGMTKLGAPGKGAGISGTAAGQVERLTQSMTQVSGAIKSLASLPVTTTSPTFLEKNFNGSIFTAPLSVLNQKLSAESAQMLQTRMSGVARNLASLETGGAATGLVGLAQSIQDGVGIKSGAKLYVALDKLAEMRRIVDDSARAVYASSKYTEDQKNLVRQNVEIVHTAIPFTQDDITNALQAGEGKSPKIPKEDKNLSFTDFVEKHSLGTTEEPVKKESKSKAKPGEEVHEDAKGNKAVKRNGVWVEVE